jgi:hypothetical protein
MSGLRNCHRYDVAASGPLQQAVDAAGFPGAMKAARAGTAKGQERLMHWFEAMRRVGASTLLASGLGQSLAVADGRCFEYWGPRCRVLELLGR